MDSINSFSSIDNINSAANFMGDKNNTLQKLL